MAAVVLPSELLDRAFATAQAILRNGPVAIAAAKAAIRNGLNMGKWEGLKYEAAQFSLAFHSKDRVEGMLAFVEKRKPVFRGS